LFIEDDPADFELCIRELEKAGLEPIADLVRSPEEFCARLNAQIYDVILSDYRLPGWTGMDALEFLRQQGKNIPLILVTGALGEEMAVECVKRGVSDYVLKDHSSRLPLVISRAIEERFFHEERIRAETALRESETRFRTMAETIASVVFIHQGTQCRYANRAAEIVTGYTNEELLALSSWDLIHPDSRELVIEQGLAHLQGGQAATRYEMKILTKQGDARWLDVTVGRLEFDGQPAGLTSAFDITERKLVEEGVRHRAAGDLLTGLASNQDLVEVFDAEKKRSERTGRSFGLLLLDLDGLERINELEGYLIGSRALCRLANILRLSCRATDVLVRNGGDEFAVILPETTAAGVQVFARRISERLANDTEEPSLSVSAGAAIYPRDGGTLEGLLKAADRNLRRGRGVTQLAASA
jgi:diguanylate cyclase (GGDEF)-like protein/PAS domain S-box-containing protein